MPDYVFHLRDGPATEPKQETVQAADVEEARILAEIRLSLSNDFTHIDVHRGNDVVIRLNRDSVGPL